MAVKKYHVTVDDEGTTRWYKNAKCKTLHRENGPAIEWADGTKFWHQNGRRHVQFLQQDAVEIHVFRLEPAATRVFTLIAAMWRVVLRGVVSPILRQAVFVQLPAGQAVKNTAARIF